MVARRRPWRESGATEGRGVEAGTGWTWCCIARRRTGRAKHREQCCGSPGRGPIRAADYRYFLSSGCAFNPRRGPVPHRAQGGFWIWRVCGLVVAFGWSRCGGRGGVLDAADVSKGRGNCTCVRCCRVAAGSTHFRRPSVTQREPPEQRPMRHEWSGLASGVSSLCDRPEIRATRPRARRRPAHDVAGLWRQRAGLTGSPSGWVGGADARAGEEPRVSVLWRLRCAGWIRWRRRV